MRLRACVCVCYPVCCHSVTRVRSKPVSVSLAELLGTLRGSAEHLLDGMCVCARVCVLPCLLSQRDSGTEYAGQWVVWPNCGGMLRGSAEHLLDGMCVCVCVHCLGAFCLSPPLSLLRSTMWLGILTARLSAHLFFPTVPSLLPKHMIRCFWSNLTPFTPTFSNAQ